MAAKKSLMDTMQSFDKSASSATMEPPAAEQPAADSPAKGAPSRKGKRAVTGYVSQSAFTQLQILRAERGMDVQELVTEALNDIFKKYGKPAIA